MGLIKWVTVVPCAYVCVFSPRVSERNASIEDFLPCHDHRIHINRKIGACRKSNPILLTINFMSEMKRSKIP